MNKLWIHWTNGVRADVLGYLLSELPSQTGVPVRLGHPFELMGTEYRMQRDQYRATPLLARLEPGLLPGEGLLALTEADLYALGSNFVFGEADPAGRSAIVSLFRLGLGEEGHQPPRDVFFRRVLTESVHETGHLLGIDHCSDPECAMHFSDSLPETDRKGPGLCARCREKLH